ncbi:MAG TPA: hypothetical protein VE978_26760 [Chitinophagales bacterium]|nr:hypothetical protein [Chitinophagales bacterium]
MTRYILPLILILCACRFEPKEHAELFPVNESELIYKKGDCIRVKIDSGNYIAGIVLDFSKDEGGLWYGVCFTNYLDTIAPDISTIKSAKLFGRKVQSEIDARGYFIGLDFCFILDSCISSLDEEIKLLGNIKLDNAKIRLGAETTASTYYRLVAAYKWARGRRLLPPDDYRRQFKLDKFRPEEYFYVKEFMAH